MKAELRAITVRNFMWLSDVVISSTIPSTKYSCSGSPLMFWKGRTTIDGLAASAGGPSNEVATGDAAAVALGIVVGQSAALHTTRNARTGRSIFFKARLPRSWKVAFRRPDTKS